MSRKPFKRLTLSGEAHEALHRLYLIVTIAKTRGTLPPDSAEAWEDVAEVLEKALKRPKRRKKKGKNGRGQRGN